MRASSWAMPARTSTYAESPDLAHSIDPTFFRQLPAWLATTLDGAA